jgi:hypothetical protein
MATSLTSPLPSIHPVLDPLIVSLADASAPASGRTGQSQCEVQIEVEDTLNSGTYRLIGELLNPYDYTTDTAKAVLHKTLQGALSFFLPNLTVSGSQAMAGPIKRYRLKARDVVDGVSQGSFVTTDPGRAWLAGQSYTAHGTNLLTGKAYLFLTTRSLTRRLHPQEKIHLQVLPAVSGTPTVRIKAIFTDGTNQTDTVTLSAASALVPFAVNITLPTYSKTARTIEIDITGLTGTAEKLTYQLIAKPTPFFRQIFYANSLGGLDHICLTGKAEEINTPTGELFEAQEYPSANGQIGNTQAFNQRATDSLTLRTGYLSEAEARSLRDLTLRNEAWILEGTSLRKILITNGSWTVKADDQYLQALQLSVRYAWDELAYSR